MIMIITSNILQLFIMHIIFTMRIYTLSNAYTRFQILVVVTLVISLTASTVFAALTINEILPAFIYSSQFKTCIYLTPNKTLYPVLITTPSLMLETLIFVATIYHTIQFQRKVSALEGARSVGILKRLLLHGGQFYALVILSRVSIFLSVYTAPLGVQNLVPTCNYFLTSVIISRFVLSLQREIVDSRKPEESGLGMTGPSIMITRTPITFPYSERLFGDSGGGGGNNSFEPETFISMETLGPYSRNEESDEHAHIPSSNERDFDH
ncbi:hypothetical protein FRB91_011728 [Serendipita sp. 411]|nr:hypothetical protein FRB91_011728 [Serendipita sp. 411]